MYYNEVDNFSIFSSYLKQIQIMNVTFRAFLTFKIRHTNDVWTSRVYYKEDSTDTHKKELPQVRFFSNFFSPIYYKFFEKLMKVSSIICQIFFIVGRKFGFLSSPVGTRYKDVFKMSLRHLQRPEDVFQTFFRRLVSTGLQVLLNGHKFYAKIFIHDNSK